MAHEIILKNTGLALYCTVHSQETYLHFSEVHWITDDVKDAEIAIVVTVVIMVCVIND